MLRQHESVIADDDSPEYDAQYFAGPVFHVNDRIIPARKSPDEPIDPDVLAFVRRMTPLVQMEKEVLGGMPVFRNTLAPLKRMFDYLLAGRALEEFLHDYPEVTPDKALHVLNNGTTLFYENISKALEAASRRGQT